jgi:hypothetical protein
MGIFEKLKSAVSSSNLLTGTVDRFAQLVNATFPPSPFGVTYPIDLGSNPEYRFAVRFDIFETGGKHLERKRYIQNAAAAKIINSGGGIIDTAIGLGIGAAGPIIDVAKAGFGKEGIVNNQANAGKGRDSYVEEQVGIAGGTTFVGNVFMYLPGAINISYKMEYEDADLTAMDILKGLRSLTETQSAGGGAAQAEIARKVGMSALKVADSITELVGGKDGLTKILAGNTRQVENPFIVHLFKGVGRRTFRFAFSMIPRSEEEAYEINEIVTTFRKYAHPLRSEGGRYLDYPAEFNISFLYNNKENIRIPKIRKCALVGINLTYGEVIFTTTKPDDEGMVNPTRINMELEFSELELLTQQSITEQGA